MMDQRIIPGKYLEDYAARDTRMHIIDQKNGGPSAARNNGLNYAEGEYVFFLIRMIYWWKMHWKSCMKKPRGWMQILLSENTIFSMAFH